MKSLALTIAVLLTTVIGLGVVNTKPAAAAYGQFRLYNNSRSANWVAYRDLSGNVRRLYPGQNSGTYRTSSVYIPSGCYGYIIAQYSTTVRYAPGGQYTAIPLGSYFLDASANVEVRC